MTARYLEGSLAPDAVFTVIDEQTRAPIAFNVGYTAFSVLVARNRSAEVLFTKTTGLTGLVDGVRIAWSAGELNVLKAGRQRTEQLYVVQLNAARDDGKIEKYADILVVAPSLG